MAQVLKAQAASGLSKKAFFQNEKPETSPPLFQPKQKQENKR